MTETIKTRQAAYRDRQTADLRELRRLQELVAGNGNEPETQDRQWFAIDLAVNREERTGTLYYMMDGRNAGRLLSDIETSDPENPKIGIYAFASRDYPEMPGTTTLVLIGLSVANMQKIDGYKPPRGYNLSEATVTLLTKG